MKHTPSPLQRDAVRIFEAGLRAADPVEAIRRHVRVEADVLYAGRRRYPLDKFERIYVLGAGKAGAKMAYAVEQLLGGRISEGHVNVKDGHAALPRGRRVKRIRLHECGHPVPDGRGVEGAKQIAAIAEKSGARDLVVCLVSGGASALSPMPAPPVTLEDKRNTTRLLLASGADIHEINSVRKHISGIKGGRLAELAYPATVLTLILSDVIGDNLDVIGSGLTAPDASTYADALAVLAKHGLSGKVPRAVRAMLEAGAVGRLPETPKAGAPPFLRTQNLIVGSNRLALAAAEQEAKRLGYRTVVLSSTIDGEAREVARVHAAIAKEIRATGRPTRPPACVVSGGETTVTLRGKGTGGRNQEFVLAAALALEGVPDVCVLSAGTDGTDGPTDAAGGVADGTTVGRARQSGLDAAGYLARNDSYHFLDATGGLIKTGPTNTNVMDVQIVLVG